MTSPLRPASLKVRALQWLGQREHSPLELRAKLLRAANGRRVSSRSTGHNAVDIAVDSAVDRPGNIAVDDATDDDPRASSAAKAQAAAVEVDALLEWLSAHGHLSPQRFVESRIHSRQSRFGNQRIRQELRQHGLAPDAATQQSLSETELARATEVWRRKFGEPAADATGKLRQMRFLAGRGFSSDVVRRVIRSEGRGQGGTAAQGQTEGELD